MELTRAVGENLKRIRKSKKLSMERLAAEAGVSRSMLGQIERGEANPSVGLLGKLAGALKVPAEVLLENDDFEPLLLLRELDYKAAGLDGGKALLRPSLPYDDVLRQETFFLALYIRGRYAPEPLVPGCVCLATSLSGTVLLHAEGQDFQLLRLLGREIKFLILLFIVKRHRSGHSFFLFGLWHGQFAAGGLHKSNHVFPLINSLVQKIVFCTIIRRGFGQLRSKGCPLFGNFDAQLVIPHQGKHFAVQIHAIIAKHFVVGHLPGRGKLVRNILNKFGIGGHKRFLSFHHHFMILYHISLLFTTFFLI